MNLNPHASPGTRLHKRFSTALSKVVTLTSATEGGQVKNKTIRVVFHGTEDGNVDSILASGLDPALRKRFHIHSILRTLACCFSLRQAFGRGEYFGNNIKANAGTNGI